MNDLVHEWIAKAEGGFRVALRESRVADQPSWDAVCFHSQQCIEKYAKGFLQDHGVEFEHTHDMTYLHAKCCAVEVDFASYQVDFERLDEYSVDIRYPGDTAAEEDARSAVEIAARLRVFIRAKLGLAA